MIRTIFWITLATLATVLLVGLSTANAQQWYQAPPLPHMPSPAPPSQDWRATSPPLDVWSGGSGGGYQLPAQQQQQPYYVPPSHRDQWCVPQFVGGQVILYCDR